VEESSFLHMHGPASRATLVVGKIIARGTTTWQALERRSERKRKEGGPQKCTRDRVVTRSQEKIGRMAADSF
jgi:hypothetical protein